MERPGLSFIDVARTATGINKKLLKFRYYSHKDTEDALF